MSDEQNCALVRRVLVLRKLQKIGVIWAEHGKFWISDQDQDGRLGTKRPISFEALTMLVEMTEEIERKPPASTGRIDSKSLIA